MKRKAVEIEDSEILKKLLIERKKLNELSKSSHQSQKKHLKEANAQRIALDQKHSELTENLINRQKKEMDKTVKRHRAQEANCPSRKVPEMVEKHDLEMDELLASQDQEMAKFLQDLTKKREQLAEKLDKEFAALDEYYFLEGQKISQEFDLVFDEYLK